jgi:hypothetical protein
MGVAFLLVIFTGIFIAPMVLGAFIVAQDADMKTINGWFGFSILIFIAIAVLGAAFLATHTGF